MSGTYSPPPSVSFTASLPPSFPRPCSVLPPPPGPLRCFKGRRRGREGIRGWEGGLCFVLMSEREQPSGCCSGADGSGFKPRFVISPSSLPSFSPTPCRCAWIAGLWRLMFRGRGRGVGGETNNNNPNNLLSLAAGGGVCCRSEEGGGGGGGGGSGSSSGDGYRRRENL